MARLHLIAAADEHVLAAAYAEEMRTLKIRDAGPLDSPHLLAETIRLRNRRQAVSLLILVVDDEPDVEALFRQQFRRDLRDGRFAMHFAQSAATGLDLIERAEDVTLILILSDINMPGMSGLELLPLAKAARPDVPVIMITAYGDAETKRQALEGGAASLLTKPIDFQELRSEIDMLVEHLDR